MFGVAQNITESKRAEQSLTEFARQQEALYQLADHLHRMNSLEDACNAALDAILNALQCARASILLFDDTNMMRFVAWRGLSDDYRKATDGHSPWKPDAKNPEPICINDIGAAELSDSLKAVIKGEGIGSLAFIPLVSNGKLIGKLMVYFNVAHIFSEGELDLSLTIAHQLAFGIERKQAEEALRQSEERFAWFMQHLPGLAWIKDIQGHYIYANAAAEKAFKTPRAGLYGKTDQDIFPPEVAAQFKMNDERALTDGRGVQVIETLKHDDGVLHYSLVSKFPIPGPNGDTALIGGTAFDITEGKRAEEALRASEERYRGLFDLVPIAVYTCDANGLIQEYNHRAVELWGREPEKNNPKEKYCGSFKIYYPDGRFMPHEECPMRRILHGEVLEPHELEILVERQDGVRRNVIAHPLPLKNERGEIIEAINCLYDITERKQAEEALQQLNLQLESRVQKRTATIQAINQSLRNEIAERERAEESLRESEATARLLLNTAPDGVVITDGTGVIVHVNAQIASLFGYEPHEVLGKQIEVLIPERFRDRHIQHRRTYHDQRRKRVMGLGMDLFGRHKNGYEFPVDVMLTPILNITGWDMMVTIRDSTERKEMESALRKSHEHLRILSQRLVEVQEEERRALARELHDRVGQTLAALNINLIIIRGQLSADVTQQIGTRLNDSMKLVAETIALVRDVMTDLRPAVLDDYGLEAALESHLAQFISRYNVNAKLKQPDRPIPRMGPSIEMTFMRIAQEALMNIARHAHADEVNLTLWQDGHSVSLTIQDNGIGIESWQEANRPGSHGLTIMRERAEAFGGSLRVKSVPGQGTKVEVSIPLMRQNEAREEKHL